MYLIDFLMRYTHNKASEVENKYESYIKYFSIYTTLLSYELEKL